jgi:hypothetical protein
MKTKAQRAAPRPSPGALLPKKKSLAQRLARLEEKFEASANLQTEKLKELGKTIATLWNNEVELDKSANRLDEQFAVLARMMFVRFNELILRVDGSNTIDEKSIEVAFREWAEFRGRPDFRNLMMEWFLGMPLKEMPPPPKPKAVEPSAEAPDQEAEGPQEFGGDYAQGQDGDCRDETVGQSQPQDSEESKADAMPEGQDTDGTLPGGEGAAVP